MPKLEKGGNTLCLRGLVIEPAARRPRREKNIERRHVSRAGRLLDPLHGTLAVRSPPGSFARCPHHPSSSAPCQAKPSKQHGRVQRESWSSAHNRQRVLCVPRHRHRHIVCFLLSCDNRASAAGWLVPLKSGVPPGAHQTGVLFGSRPFTG